jgi:hypothetical protein
MTPDELQDIGVDVARQCTWDGNAIVKAFFEALTDANYHSLRSRLEDAINNYIEDCGAPL